MNLSCGWLLRRMTLANPHDFTQFLNELTFEICSLISVELGRDSIVGYDDDMVDQTKLQQLFWLIDSWLGSLTQTS